ncbi:MAG: carbon starvation CstA family protein [Terracidiphilus sp.]
MDALPLVLLVLGIFVVAYRYYGAFLAARVFALDDRNITPAHRFNDGHNYVPRHAGSSSAITLRRLQVQARW